MVSGTKAYDEIPQKFLYVSFLIFISLPAFTGVLADLKFKIIKLFVIIFVIIFKIQTNPFPNDFFVLKIKLFIYIYIYI
jgi:hypothetical protein